MQKIAQHKVLVTGDSFENCCDQVRRFFDLTSLVMYDCIQVAEEQCSSGLDADFLEQVTTAEKKNQQAVDSLVTELEQTGATRISDLRTLEHGYPSKTLHILTHFLDGFIGIDSYFYNLTADSHWLTAAGKKAIQKKPGTFWLIHIDCFSATPDEAGLIRL